MTKTARFEAFVEGDVQGVGFRWWTRERARVRGLTGFANNMSDGRVHVVAQGPRSECESLVRQLRGGQTPGYVTAVDIVWLDPVLGEDRFAVGRE